MHVQAVDFTVLLSDSLIDSIFTSNLLTASALACKPSSNRNTVGRDSNWCSQTPAHIAGLFEVGIHPMSSIAIAAQKSSLLILVTAAGC